MKSIYRKIGSVEERVKRLKSLSDKIATFQDYLVSPDAKDIAERNLQVAIETCLDIGKIIISQKGLSEPKDNKGIFTSLAEAGFVSKETLTFMLPMAGTRNILVHGYDKIDDEIMYGILKRHLDDMLMFLREVRENYLSQKDVNETPL
jgi:uncharacterized protein YutE (UPF0331/DUF86 family)